MKQLVSLQSSATPLIMMIIRALWVMINIIAAIGIGGSSGVSLPFLPQNEQLPAVFVFGDSVVDTGNNNYVKSYAPVRCDFPPYGKDFEGGKPTGRYSNGRVPSDMLGMYVCVYIFIYMHFYIYYTHTLINLSKYKHSLLTQNFY